MYTYFVSYVEMNKTNTGVGRCTLNVDEKITSIEQIEEIEKELKRQNPKFDFIIMNYKLLGKTEEKDDE